MPETAQLIDFFQSTNKLKEVSRYEENKRKEKFNGDTTAEHTWRVTYMVGRVIDYYQLPVKKIMAIEMAMDHDLLELITKDYSARLLRKKPWLKKQRHMKEVAAMDEICRIIPEPFRARFCELIYQYQDGIIPEAVLVKALDKCESTLHIIDNSTKEMVCDGFFPVYGKEHILKAVKMFPKLRPFFLEIRKRIRAEVEKYGGKWKREYDYLENGNY